MKYKRIIIKFIINNFLCYTHFFCIKRTLLCWCGFKIGNNTKIVGPIYFGNKINIKIGNNCWIGRNISFDGDGYVIVGNNVDIAPNVSISTGGHKIGTHDRRAGLGIINKIIIDDGCWIGTNVLLINNIEINSGSIVAAGSVVIKNIGPNLLVAGNPAIEKRRLSDD